VGVVIEAVRVVIEAVRVVIEAVRVVIGTREADLFTYAVVTRAA